MAHAHRPAEDPAPRPGSDPKDAWLDAVLADDDLTPSAKVVAVVLNRMADADPILTVEHAAVADAAGTTRRRVRQAVRALEAAGFLETQPEPPRPTDRTLTLHWRRADV